MNRVGPALPPLCFYALAAVALAGCSAAPYSCGVPLSNGKCQSLSEVHRDTVLGTGGPTQAAATPTTAPPSLVLPGLGSPLLSRPSTLRVRVRPWEDSDGDLHAGGYIYLRMGRGEWTATDAP